jgi:hypothetical protein
MGKPCGRRSYLVIIDPRQPASSNCSGLAYLNYATFSIDALVRCLIGLEDPSLVLDGYRLTLLEAINELYDAKGLSPDSARSRIGP